MLEYCSQIRPNYALARAQLRRVHPATASLQFGGPQQHEKAQTAYERALALEPSQIDARIFMANLFTDTGRLERGAALLRNVLKTNRNLYLGQ